MDQWQLNPRAGEHTPASDRPVTDIEAVEIEVDRQIPCPVCGFPIGSVRGSKEAICRNCGFKDGCC